MSQTFTQQEEMDEGQEEWLSEEMLTDEDCNQTAEQDGSDSALGQNSQLDSSLDNTNLKSQDTMEKIDDSNIEETLNSLDSERQQSDLPAELDDFLIRKPTVQAAETSHNKEQEETDGNDTDDLLRMLEDDDKSKKSKVLTHLKEKRTKPSSDDDDDEFIYEGQKAQKLKVVKSVLMRKIPASKAVPEESSDSDESPDEASTMKKMFAMKRKNNVASKSTSKPINYTTQVVKVTSEAVKKDTPKKVTSTPKPPLRKSNRLIKTKVANGQQVVQQVVRHVHANNKVVDKTVDRIVGVKTDTEVKNPTKPDSTQEHEEIINEEEFLEEKGFDLDEDFAEESDTELDRRAMEQRIMKPEQVDEDMLSDVESLSEEFSDFNEFGSYDSEQDGDWFMLDIRGERAGDYIPMLGAKAHELLLEEKKRVALRLESLKESLGNLSENGEKQSDKLRGATAELAEIDAMLRAS